MLLSVIKREIENYKVLILSPEYDEVYKWAALQRFQDSWDGSALDFKAMYDESLKSRYSNNLWANPHWFPKAVMLTFIEYDNDRVRAMFISLFDEDQKIDKRIERFVHDCEKLRDKVAIDNPNYRSHFHDGQRIISLYLAFRYPDKYAIYKFTEFKKFMELVQSSNIPGTGDYERFFKTVRTVYEILRKDEELVRFHRSVLTDDCYKGETLMLAQDFIFRTARRYM